MIWPVIGTIAGAAIGLGGTLLGNWQLQHHRASEDHKLVKQEAYVNFLKLSDAVQNLPEGKSEAYEQPLRQSLALIQLMGSAKAKEDAQGVADAALEGKDNLYNDRRAVLVDDARADVK